MRLLALMLASWLAVGTIPSAAAAPPRDFIAEMTVPLAVDPAAADERADDEIARARSAQIGQSDAATAAAYWVKAQANFRLGDFAASRAAIGLAKRFAPVDESGQRVRAYVSLLEALLARSDGDFGKALTELRRAQQGFLTAQDRRGHALALQSLGVLYNDVGNGSEAVRYLSLAEQAYDGDDVFRLSLNNNFGVALQALSRFEDSERRLIAARGFARRLDIDAFARQITLNIAANQVFAGKLRAAQQSLDNFEAMGGVMTQWQTSELHRIRAMVAWRNGQRDRAISEVRRSLRGIDGSSTDTSFWNMHFAAYEILAAYGLRGEAFVQLEAVRRLEEIENELTASNRAALLSAQFQFDAQDAQINQLKADNLEREVGFQRTMTATIVVAALLALGLLASLLVTAIRARNRARRDAAELSVVNQRLEQALAAKTEFLASTSHELRTPLNGILGMTQILLADAGVAPRHRTQIELLHDAGSTMRALVDDILDVAKIEHGGFTINPKPTDVAALAQRVTRLFAAQADNAGLTLDLDVDLVAPCGLVDPDRLTQILFNLIGNALKFTPEGHVQISVSEAAAVDGEDSLPSLILSVRDSGIGIAPEWHDSVFDMFRQVDGARTRNYGGTGLGLAICRQLARAMGGDIALTSAPGEGSTFTVTLPWEVVATAPPNIVSFSARAASGEAPEPTPATVAIVAGDPMRAAMLAAIVRRAGLTPSAAENKDDIAAAMTSNCLTLLVDASAWALVDAIAGEQADRPDKIIIVGGCDGEADMDQAGASPHVVAFSRNAVAAALGRISRSAPDSGLPDAAHGGIARAHQGSEPKRSVPMSRK